MILETKPTSPLAMSFPPSGGKRYKVKTGDNWISVAAHASIRTWELIEFNFPAVRDTKDIQKKCREVNWSLRTHVGCAKSADGDNYRFDSADKPGYIYIPDSLYPGGSGGCGTLTAAERRDILDMGGAKMLAWAEEPPTADVESAEFRPTAKHRADFQVILAWKSCDPARTCPVDGKRRGLQAVMLLRDDLDYWRARTSSEMEAVIKSTAQEVAVRAYRWRILDRHQCPVAARVGEAALSDTLILMMAGGFLAIMPTPSVVGSKTVKQVASVVGYVAKKLEEWLGD